MILIDDNKTIIAGDALKVITEIAVVLDRLMSEVADRGDKKITYDVLMDRFLDLVSNVQDVRDGAEDFNPNEILGSGRLQKLYPEDFFGDIAKKAEGSRYNERVNRADQTESSAEDSLKKAMEKLEKAKKNASDSKKKKGQ